MLKKISIYQIGLLPIALVAGPLIAEILLLLTFINFIYFFYREKKSYIFNEKILKIFLIFWIYIVVISFFSVEKFISLKSSFFYIRFGLYTLSIVYFLNSISDSIETIYKIYKYTLIFVILDSFYQIFTGQDIFGLKPNNDDLMRISGPFGDKFILGSFLQKILPVFIYLILKIKKNNDKIKISDFLILILSIVLIYRSGDRSALGLILLFSFIFFLINKSLRKNIIKIFVLFLIFSILLTIQNPRIFERTFLDTIGQIKGKYYENFLEKDISETKFNFMIFSFHHQSHYSTAVRMFLNKPIFGHGPKSFRIMCKDFEFKPNKNIKNSFGEIKKGYGCSTHPHNTYLQLLAETGIIGFSFIFCFFIYLTYKILNLIKNNDKKYIYNSLMIGIFINLWPIIPTGNFFNNWLSMVYFIPISFYLYEIKKIK
tara:strand:- start:7921 stop:9207 length:1287 start_codon:yes stop_codon:yes gene_type:complete